jgi:hypothetical protein
VNEESAVLCDCRTTDSLKRFEVLVGKQAIEGGRKSREPFQCGTVRYYVANYLVITVL